ncbi:ABC transporter permease [Schleiferilactobacillus harbinensis]|jgi:ABC-2 type transport system permease protein|uniref:ABC transporter permease n=1 Tax=Schleiferilactobacillus harbinensis TaxID=304207 RepID=UPI0007B93A7C|nr:ABC transporter permease subunit [Schleiferilactobacillus harbinensis]
MFNLFRNEWRKLWAKKSSWILLLIAAVISGLTAWGAKALNTSFTVGTNGAATGGSTGAIKAADAFSSIFSSGAAFVVIFAIVMTAIIITEEFAKNTIKILLTRPYSRHAILFSKLLASFAYLVVSLLTIYVVAALFTGAFFGFGGLDKVVGHGMNSWLYGLADVGVNVLSSMFYLSMVFVLAAGMRSQGLAITFSILMQLVLGIFSGLLDVLMTTKKWYWIKWNPFNLMAYNPLSSSQATGAAALNVWGWLIGLVIYIAIFYFIADYIFNRRDVSLS